VVDLQNPHLGIEANRVLRRAYCNACNDLLLADSVLDCECQIIAFEDVPRGEAVDVLVVGHK
jgi:hypothetical protein